MNMYNIFYFGVQEAMISTVTFMFSGMLFGAIMGILKFLLLFFMERGREVR